MISDQQGQALHHKASLNQPMTREEQTQLQQWYDQQDAAEMQLLAQPAINTSAYSLQSLQHKIEIKLMSKWRS